MKKQLIFIFCIFVFIFILASNVSADTFNSNKASTWDNNNWNKVSSMDKDARDKAWDNSGSEKNDIIKKLASKEGSSGLFGWGTKEGSKIDSVKGFEDSKLKWYTDSSGKKVIGDGKTYLDLDHLPKDANGLEYSNGRFIVSRKDGSKITLDVGSTDENGKLSAFKYNDLKNAKGLDSLELKTGKNSEIILTKDGFNMKGSDETQIKIGDLSFDRKAGETSDSSNVLVGKDRYVLKNTEFKKDNWVIAKPTANDFTVNFGSYKNLADYSYFNDVDGKRTYISFDSLGRISSISRDDINNGNWVKISGDKIEGDLKKIWESSGNTIKTMLEDQIYRPDESDHNLAYLKDKFYKDPKLRDYAQELQSNYFKDNTKDFLSINGLSFEVGGKGEVSALRELTGISAISSTGNPADFKVNVGDIPITFDSEGIHYPSGAVKNSFKVGDISMILDGKSFDKICSITGTSNGNKIVSDSNYFVGGREVHTTDNGFIADIHMDIPREDISKIQAKIDTKGTKEYYSDYLSDVMKDSKYSVKADLYAPSSLIKDSTFGVIDPSKQGTISGSTLAGLSDTLLMPAIEQRLKDLVISPDNQDMQLRSETISDIKDLVKTAIANTPSINFGSDFTNGKFTIGFQNNPGGDPSLLLGLPGGEIKEIPLKNTPDGPQTATFAKDILKSSIRIPEIEKGTITNYEWSTTAYLTGRYGENQFWPRDYLRTLWNNKLGRGSEQWERMAGPTDKEFFKGENGIINTYLKKK